MIVNREDATAYLEAPTMTPAGYLKAQAWVTRTGVFVYTNPDGSTRRELRPAEEVFSQASLDSLALAPVTDGHPPKMLDAKSTKDYQRGTLASARADGDKVRADVLITDSALIAKAKGKKTPAVSLGYSCEIDPTSGTTPAGERFDSRQINIRYNHLALVDIARGGEGIQLRADELTPKGTQMKTVKIDGADHECSDIIAAHIVTLQARADEAEGRALIATQRADSANTTPANVKAEMRQRLKLEEKAREYRFDSASIEKATDRQLQEGILRAKGTLTADQMKDRSDAFVAGALAAAIGAELTSLDKTRVAIFNNTRLDAAGTEDPEQAARERNKQFYRDTHKQVSSAAPRADEAPAKPEPLILGDIEEQARVRNVGYYK